MTAEYLKDLQPKTVIRHQTYIFLAAIGIVFALLTVSARAQTSDRSIDIGDAAAPGSINAYVDYYLEDARPQTVAEAIALDRNGAFKPIETTRPDFGYFPRGIWLKLDLENLTQNQQDRVLVMHTNFMVELGVHLVTESDVETLLDHEIDTPFTDRAVPYHQIAAPFVMDARERATIYIRYRSQGNTVMPLSLQTPLSFSSITSQRMMVDFSFYGVMAMFVAVSLIGRLFWPNPTFIAYAFYASAVLLYIFQRDGYAFQYLWPQAPVWNNYSSLPLGAALPAFAAIFTRTYLNTKTIHKNIDRLLIGIVILQALVVLLSIPFGASFSKKLAVLTTTLSVTIFFLIGVAAYLKYGRRTLFFVVGWFGILCASMVMTIAHWVNADITRAQTLDVMRVAMVFDALMLGLASVFNVVDLQRDREKLNQERIAALDTNLQLHNRLAGLEQKYHLARTLAETNNRLLVDTTHDLRQPLYALRAAMTDLNSSAPSGQRVDEIAQSITYIENLVQAALDNAIDADEEAPGDLSAEAAATPANKVLQAVKSMFEADAERQNVNFVVAPSHAHIDAPAFPVLRILINCVSNAIKYNPGARVLVGVRKKGDKVSLEVHDTGNGLSQEQLELVKARGARGDDEQPDDDGKGVGLSIVSQLVEQYDLDWTLESQPGKGTVSRLIVPAVR